MGLTQDIATTPGTTYEVDFWISTTGVPPNFFMFDWDAGAPEYVVAHVNPSFSSFHFTLQATQALTPLTFGFTQFESGAWRLDDVSVVPVPGTMMLAVLGVAGVVRRRRG